MVQNLGDIQGGMEVFGLDGSRIGTITDVRLSPLDHNSPNVAGAVAVPLPPGAAGTEPGGTEDPDRAEPLQPERETRRVPGGPAQEIVGVAVIAPTRSATSYFEVEDEAGDKTYYIPFAAVSSCFPGQNVTLDCTRQECRDRYFDVPQ